MPRSGVPYRAYFVTRTQVQWFDATAEGDRSWSRVHRIEDVWPGLSGLFPDRFNVPSYMVRGLLPASATTLRITGGSPNYPPTAHVDITTGALVPDPRATGNLWDDLHVLSWDVGPVVMFRHADQTATLVDLRDHSLGPVTPFDLDTSSPIVAVPGEPIRWFTADSPPRVSFRVGAATSTVAASTAFPGLLLTDPIVDTTIVYGECRTVLADATAALNDADVRTITDRAGSLGVSPEELLAALYVLSGLAPTAYHPQGSYGLAQMTADQLRAGGWNDAPEAILDAGVPRQISVLASYLATMPAHADIVWLLAVLLVGQPIADVDDATVVARAPYPARLRGFAAATQEGVVGDVVTVGDLRRVIAAVLAGPVQRELRNRAAEISLA